MATTGGYAAVRPHVVPDTLEELTGPADGGIVRERNYTRVDVTDQIDWHGEKPTENHVVYAYVPTEKAIQRLVTANAEARVVRRRMGYLDIVHKGFNELAGPEAVSEFQETTVEPTLVPWVSLTERIDPELALQGFKNSRQLGDYSGQAGLIGAVERDSP